ncbi:MAG: ATP-dependent DNA helicase RecG [Bacteroidales bacterium]|nr:ATP-dependent DNA helicase RecG [Bacteroidales bacterium]
MNATVFNKDIKYLPGVGPKRAKLLSEELNIRRYGDLLYYFPYKYIDRTRFYNIKDVHPDLANIQIKGKIVKFELAGKPNKRRLIGYFADETGLIKLVWFRGINWIKKSYSLDKDYVIFGKPTVFNQQINIIHPEIESLEEYNSRIQQGLEAHYNTTERLKKNYINSKVIRKLQNNLLQEVKDKIGETLPEKLINQLKLNALNEALIHIHFPQNWDQLLKAQYRLKFEELFYVELNILEQKNTRIRKFSGFNFEKVGALFNSFYNKKLPFKLTNAQKKVLKEIRRDLGSGLQMNRLLQGDVGSGKTLVALMSILIALDNNYQSCIMAPTEILANQHYESITRFLDDLPVSVKLLTGSTPAVERKKIHEALLNGELQILIGTHALIEDTVQFKNLGLVVIDEQHRFGVAQRAKLWKKNTQPPHVLVMTATPIPRTLSMTIYGDLDVSVIDELPPGRKPVKTVHLYEAKRLRLIEFMRKMIHKGRQIYIVYPLIRESEKLDLKDLEEGYETILRYFPPPKYAVSVVHGRMKPEEKAKSMGLFARGQTNIMVSTTVIEVGVDVPNASVMVIENAERFGLSQLHQLRGRIGRGKYQSYCVLMTSDKLSEEARKRIQALVQSNDGFEIAEADLQLRGPGDIEGTQQSGIPFDLKIANLGKDSEILTHARKVAMEILEDDPELKSEAHGIVKEQLRLIRKRSKNYSVVS